MENFKEKARALYIKYESIILYVFFGGLTTVVSFVTHFGARSLGGSVGFATTISWICAVLFAFFTNKKWVFKSSTVGFLAFFTQLLSFFGARLFSLAVELIIMKVFVEELEFNEFIVKIGANVVVLTLNFFLSKFFIFKKRK